MSTTTLGHPVPAARYVLVEIFQPGIGNSKVICSGINPLALYTDVANAVEGVFIQICENNCERINLDFDLNAYRQMFDADFNGEDDDWSWIDITKLFHRQLSAHADALNQDDSLPIWGDWSELIKWVTDDLGDGDGIQFAIEGGIPDFARKLLEWEQDRWQGGMVVPSWWCALRDLLQDRCWWLDLRGEEQFNRIIQDFDEHHCFA